MKGLLTIDQPLTCFPAFLAVRGHVLLANSNVPDVHRFPAAGKEDVISTTDFFLSLCLIKAQAK